MASVEIYVVDDSGAELEVVLEAEGDSYDDLMTLLDDARIDMEGQLYDRLIDAISGESEDLGPSEGDLDTCADCDCFDDTEDFDQYSPLQEIVDEYAQAVGVLGNSMLEWMTTTSKMIVAAFTPRPSDHHFTD